MELCTHMVTTGLLLLPIQVFTTTASSDSEYESSFARIIYEIDFSVKCIFGRSINSYSKAWHVQYLFRVIINGTHV